MGDGNAAAPAYASEGSHPALLHPSLFCELPGGLFSFQQADAYARNLFESTRNLMNTSRSERHVNPWDYPVKVHTYAEYEDHFRDAMKEVGLPVEKE